MEEVNVVVTNVVNESTLEGLGIISYFFRFGAKDKMGASLCVWNNDL